MIKGLAAAGLLALAALRATPVLAQEDGTWGLSYVDAEGNLADARTGYDVVAYVRGPRDFVLELACVQDDDRMIFRLARRVAGRERFTGESFSPTFIVRDGGSVAFEFTPEAEFQYRDGPKLYRGPVRKRLMRQLSKGDVLIVREEGSNLRVRFTLRGSAAAIAALPCAGES